MKIIIIGGVAGGATAAARLRRLNEQADITIYERTGYVSYANCGLPYYIGNVIQDKNKLTLQTTESFYNRFNISVKVKHEVIKINPLVKEITIKNLVNNEIFKDHYDKLILSPGAKPIVLPFLKQINNCFTLRTLEDAFLIKKFINEKKVKTAVIIGGGFVGVEMAEALRGLNIDVSIIQLDKNLLPMIDYDMATFIHSECLKNNVHLYLEKEVVDAKNIDNQTNVYLNDGTIINADLIICSIGVSPEVTLCKNAFLELENNNSVKVNKYMQTSNPDIYALGDAVSVVNLITKDKKNINLAGPANKQARIVADHICGINSSYNGSYQTSIIKVFDLAVAKTGLSEKECQNKNLKYEKVILSPSSHAGYYPHAKALTLKVLYDKETLEILGSTIIGYDGVDKRIDVLATAIFGKIKANLLKDLDLAYAPPYSQAKDPINLAGCIIDNLDKNLVKQFYFEDLDKLLTEDVILLDTRTEKEYQNDHAEGFINIPLDELRNRLLELDKNKKVYVMCQSGLRSYLAVRILVQNGIDAYNFAGGFRLYQSIKNSIVLTKKVYPCGMDEK